MTSIVEQAAAIGMSEEQVNAVMGSMLGDGCFRDSGKVTKGIHWNHGQVQEDYVIHKYEVLQEFATRPPLVKENPGYGDYWVVLSLKALPIFHSMYTLMRPEGSEKKTVTVEYLNEITHPIALAWWFMDDGSRTKDYNSGQIHTNGFSEEEVNLLCQWLTVRWGVEAKPCMVKHSSTGNYSHIIVLPRDGYLALMDLISPFVPECMEYKIKVQTKICQQCGKEFVVHGQTTFCSQECKETYQTNHKHEYYLDYKQTHLEELLARGAAYREAHREEIRQKSREYYANLSPEKLEHLKQRNKAWREATKDRRNEVRRDYRRRMKGDPEYEAKLKAERAAYYQRKAADPERHAHMLELQRAARQKPEIKAHNLEYQRRRRAMKIIRNPLEAARRSAWKHCRAELLKIQTEEEKQQFYQTYLQEHPECHLEAINADPTAAKIYAEMQSQPEFSF